MSIPPFNYAVLASNKDVFLSEYSSSIVADTSMTLNNSGVVKIWNGSKDTGNVVDSVFYNSTTGGSNDGNSLPS